MKGFRAKLDAAAKRSNSLLCVGLDPVIERLPTHLRGDDVRASIVAFNREIIDATSDLVCCYKPNLGFYVSFGIPGLQALLETRAMIEPTIPVILDCKLGDFSNTSAAYARGIFDAWDFDAVTIAPYMGEDGLAPFMSRPDRGVFVLCKTSNPGSAEFQDLALASGSADNGDLLFERVAERSRVWDRNHAASVGLVVGATYPEHLKRVREICPDHAILMPGIGEQQGDLAMALSVGLDANGLGLIPNASRSVTYVSQERDFASAARSAAHSVVAAINAGRDAQRFAAR
ncbi:MAG: orotidine-5'-phosphate decarboxylase [Thermomicrobiales bacterium]